MATVSATVSAIRRILQDRPIRAQLAAAITSTTAETFTVSSEEAPLFKAGEWWEHDDANGSTSSTSAEQRRIISIAGTTITAERGYNSSTAATHLISTYLVKEPRWSYDRVYAAINAVLRVDLLQNGVYEIVSHEVTSLVGTTTYDAPTSSCERILDIYQYPTAGQPTRPVTAFTQYRSVDSDVSATGKEFQIYENAGQPGVATYYINCVHPLAVTTLAARQEFLVHMGAAAYLLGWEEPKRTAGPTNQGDRTVQPGRQAQLAAYYRNEFLRLLRQEKQYLKRLSPPRREYLGRR